MQRPPSLEALRGVHAFPGPYTFKAFGPNTDAFTEQVLGRAAGVVGDPSRVTIRVRTSRGGRHCCVTLTAEVRSAEQVQAIYQALRRTEHLVMLL